jgi:hypothetical protein
MILIFTRILTIFRVMYEARISFQGAIEDAVTAKVAPKNKEKSDPRRLLSVLS